MAARAIGPLSCYTGGEHLERERRRGGKEVASAIAGRVPGVRELILFGSRADGTYSSDSDLDLFVLVDGYERDRLHTTMACAAAAAAPARRRGLKRDVIAASVGDYRQRRAMAGSVEQEVYLKGVTIYAA